MTNDGTTLNGGTGDDGARPVNGLLRFAWIGAALLLIAIFIGMQFTDEIAWTAGDFVVAGILLFGSIGTYQMATGRSGNRAYRAGFGLAIAAVLLLLWINGAVGLTDSDADMVIALLVPAVAIVGSFMARFQPAGMARAMIAAAAVHALIAVIALVAGIIPEFNSAFEILGITGFFVVLFSGSAYLFREAARATADESAG